MSNLQHRRRLFTRRELRRQGIRVVRRGSQTELVANAPPFRFDRSQQSTTRSPTPEPPEPIESCGEQEQSFALNPDAIASESPDPLVTPRQEKRTRTISSVSEKAKRLRTPSGRSLSDPRIRSSCKSLDPESPAPRRRTPKPLHLTPLGKVKDRLKPARDRPPPLFALPKM
ncbi:hypothetical protein FBU59_002199 [Linderina macrospora]|uniref:Uncharacterized protein n=1 Tax=Linderina macrospora TaxID=4868 RepID=A0ACC1JBS8_9FUNG|nr:hypothetical protein FBU59_002199 [Linderina macrospora]